MKIAAQSGLFPHYSRHALEGVDIACDSGASYKLDPAITESHLVGNADRQLNLLLACRQSGGGMGSSIDWEQRILHPESEQALFEAINEACSSKDRGAARAIVRLHVERGSVADMFLNLDLEEEFDDEHLASIAKPIAQGLVSETVSFFESHLRSHRKKRRKKRISEDGGEQGNYEKLMSSRMFGALPTLPAFLKRMEPCLDIFKKILRSDHHLAGDALLIIDAISYHCADEAMRELERYILQGRWRRSLSLQAIGEILPAGKKDAESILLLEKLLQKRDAKQIDSIPELLTSSEQRAAYRLLTGQRDIKQLVFKEATALDVLKDKQAWITINDPQVARDGLALVVKKAPKRRGQLDKLLIDSLGVRVKAVTDDHFTYYADEILDALVQFIGTSKLRSDPAIATFLGTVRYAEGPKIRYVRREQTDTKLGTKCGDCTAVGSIHFADSLMWFVSPAYQILKLSKGKRFLGKINVTLGVMAGHDAIIADATEFNPQALRGKPYYEDALETFDEAVRFLQELARKQGRELFWLKVSNSSGAVKILGDRGEKVVDEEGTVIGKAQLIVPTYDMERTLAQGGHSGRFNFFFQMVGDEDGVDVSSNISKDRTDAQLPLLEQSVINPAQMADEAIAAAMRERDFETASRLIMADEERAAEVKRIVGFPADIALSPVFLKSRLEKLFAAQAREISEFEKPFVVNGYNFVRL